MGPPSDGGAGALADAGSGEPGAFCNAEAARDARCGSANARQCIARERCYRSILPADAVAAVLQCLGDRSCTTSDESCFAQAAPSAAGAKQSAYLQTCRTRRSDCANAFSDDYCALTWLNDAAYDVLSPCLSRACGEIRDCLGEAQRQLCAEGL